MPESLAASLNRMDSTLAAIESAFERNDLTLAGSLNIALDAQLRSVSESLQATAAAGADQSIRVVAARLSAILERHQGFGEKLATMKEGVAEELTRLRRGRIGADRFLEAAEA